MEAGDLPECVLIAADAAMGAEHQIGKADGGQVRVFRRLWHVLWSRSTGKGRSTPSPPRSPLWRLCRDCNFSFSRCLASILPVTVFNYSSQAQRVDYGTCGAWKTQQQNCQRQKRLTFLLEISPMWHFCYSELFIMFQARHKRLKELLRIKVL